MGELRPHFIAVCNPDMSQINCTDQYEMPLYISQYTCLGDENDIREARYKWNFSYIINCSKIRLSFPSGHSSVATYTSVFIAVSKH